MRQFLLGLIVFGLTACNHKDPLMHSTWISNYTDAPYKDSLKFINDTTVHWYSVFNGGYCFIFNYSLIADTVVLETKPWMSEDIHYYERFDKQKVKLILTDNILKEF